MLLLDSKEIPHAASKHLQKAGEETQNQRVDLGCHEGGNGKGPGATKNEVADDGQVIDQGAFVAQGVTEQAVAGAAL